MTFTYTSFVEFETFPCFPYVVSHLQEVLNMLKESKADIFVDPVLHTACALDIKHHCAAIPPGRGRRESTDDHTSLLTTDI